MMRYVLLLLALSSPSYAAISQATLSTKLQTNLAAVLNSPQDTVQLKKVCDAIALAIVTEITTSAVVLPTALTAPSGGGAVTGTGTIQ